MSDYPSDRPSAISAEGNEAVSKQLQRFHMKRLKYSYLILKLGYVAWTSRRVYLIRKNVCLIRIVCD